MGQIQILLSPAIKETCLIDVTEMGILIHAQLFTKVRVGGELLGLFIFSFDKWCQSHHRLTGKHILHLHLTSYSLKNFSYSHVNMEFKTIKLSEDNTGENLSLVLL
jgi:hypothetical protein